MSEARLNEREDDLLLETILDPESNNRCVVCGHPTDGKAICSDNRCAEELAQG